MHNSGAAYPATKSLSAGLFKGLGNHEIQMIRAAAAKQTFQASRIIKSADLPTPHLCLIETGCVDYHVVTSDRRDILLRRLVSGNAFGYAALLAEPMGYLGSARTVHQAEILVWEHRVARQLAVFYPRLVENALQACLHYLALYAKRHIRLVSNTAQERVAYALADLGSQTGHVLSTGVEVGIKNEDLAALRTLPRLFDTTFWRSHAPKIRLTVKKFTSAHSVPREDACSINLGTLLSQRLRLEDNPRDPASADFSTWFSTMQLLV